MRKSHVTVFAIPAAAIVVICLLGTFVELVGAKYLFLAWLAMEVESVEDFGGFYVAVVAGSRMLIVISAHDSFFEADITPLPRSDC